MRIPRAFATFFLLVFLTESFVYANRADLSFSFYNRFLLNEQKLIDLPGNFDFLVMGNSIQKTGINPAYVHPSMLCLGLPATKTMGLYLLLERYLKKHRPPQAIFVYIDPEQTWNLFTIIMRYFTSFGEYVRLFPDLDREERLAYLTKFLPSLDYRQISLHPSDRYEGTNRQFVETMLSSRGYVASPNELRLLKPGYFDANPIRVQEHVSFTERDWKYLKKFFELTNEKGIRVYVLSSVMPRELHGKLSANGFMKEYLALRNRIDSQRTGNVTLDPEPVWIVDNDHFGDMQHLNRKGAVAYTKHFKENVLERFVPGAREDAEDF